MRSSFECFQFAARCEEKAKVIADDDARAGLMASAEHWRMLGNQAKAREECQVDGYAEMNARAAALNGD